MENSYHSYPKILALGHAALRNLLSDVVSVEEKVDGSQFSFANIGGELKMRSKGAPVHEGQEGMFAKAVDTCKELFPLLTEGWTYRCEYLRIPKHNALMYEREPKKNLILFDVNTGLEEYLDPIAKKAEAERLGLECVPIFHHGIIDSYEQLEQFMDQQSVLGRAKIEGIVIKSRTHFGSDGKALIGKMVSAEFKEIHGREWKKSNQSNKDILQVLTERYRVEARWQKGLQHLKESGRWTQSLKDIGPLRGEVAKDVLEECEEDIKNQLFKWAKGHIARGSTAGLPEWYKGQLAGEQFNGGDTTTTGTEGEGNPQATTAAGVAEVLERTPELCRETEQE